MKDIKNQKRTTDKQTNQLTPGRTQHPRQTAGNLGGSVGGTGGSSSASSGLHPLLLRRTLPLVPLAAIAGHRRVPRTLGLASLELPLLSARSRRILAPSSHSSRDRGADPANIPHWAPATLRSSSTTATFSSSSLFLSSSFAASRAARAARCSASLAFLSSAACRSIKAAKFRATAYARSCRDIIRLSRTYRTSSVSIKREIREGEWGAGQGENVERRR